MKTERRVMAFDPLVRYYWTSTIVFVDMARYIELSGSPAPRLINRLHQTVRHYLELEFVDDPAGRFTSIGADVEWDAMCSQNRRAEKGE